MVIIITPFVAFEPYKAEAFAPLRTVKVFISSGLILSIVPLVTVEPSTTIKASLFPFRERFPLNVF